MSLPFVSFTTVTGKSFTVILRTASGPNSGYAITSAEVICLPSKAPAPPVAPK